MTANVKPSDRGKLKIGDDWNAIRIIALSQSNPLKAIAEFVENSIDARAKTVTITRGREHGEHYLTIRDDGDGVPRSPDGRPDFKYVATHICDSIKRKLKTGGAANGLQGEFGIGLLSFWTVGGRLTMTSTGADESGAAVALSGAVVCEGTRAQEFRWRAFRPTARAHDRAVVVCGGQAQVEVTGQGTCPAEFSADGQPPLAVIVS
jgi:Histidine kinase-, DNA gyrase B-, and HSP90-like ATPase